MSNWFLLLHMLIYFFLSRYFAIVKMSTTLLCCHIFFLPLLGNMFLCFVFFVCFFVCLFFFNARIHQIFCSCWLPINTWFKIYSADNAKKNSCRYAAIFIFFEAVVILSSIECCMIHI